MATQEERRRLTKQTIIKAAAKLFKKQGFEHTSIMQVVKEANVVKATFYKHFTTKVDLLLVIGRKDGTKDVAALMQKVEQGMSPLDALQAYYIVMVQWFEAHAFIAEDVILSAIRLHNPHSNFPEQVAHDFTKLMLSIAQERGEVSKSVSVSSQAIVVGGVVTLAIIDWSKGAKSITLEQSILECFETILYGLKPSQ